jgi:hypothetical protein
VTVYQKSLAQVFVVVLPVLLGALTVANLGTWLNFALAVLTAVGVYVVPNTGGAPWLKAAVAFVGAGLQAAVAAATDNAITGAEWNAIILASVAVVATYVFPNGVPTRPAAA